LRHSSPYDIRIKMKIKAILYRLYLLPLIILFTVVLHLFSFGQNPDSIFTMANEAYRNGNFSEAATLYSKVLKENPASAALYFNLGNCFYKLQKPGHAILNYERALKEEPMHRDARFNLTLVNSQIRDNIPVPRRLFLIQWWEYGSSLLPVSWWMVIHMLFFLLALVSVAFFLLKKGNRTKQTWFRTAVTALVVSLLILGLGLQRHYDTRIVKHAIVLSDATTLMSGPGEGSSVLTEFHEGTKLKVNRIEKGWYEIETPDGHKGWIPAGDAEII